MKMKDYSIKESVIEGGYDILNAGMSLYGVGGCLVAGTLYAVSAPIWTVRAGKDIVVKPAMIMGARAIDKTGEKPSSLKKHISKKGESDKSLETTYGEVIVCDFTKTSSTVL